MDSTDKVRLFILAFVAACVGLMVALVIASRPADAASWSGCYGGAGIGYGSVDTTAELGIAGLASVEADGLSGDGASFNITGGCDAQLQRFVLGGWADWTWADDHEFALSANVPGLFSGDIATFSLEDQWSIGGRAGYLITPDVLGYVLVGYTEASFSDLEGLGGTPLAFSFSIPDMSGVVWGGGLEAALGGGLFLRGEYRYADLSSESIDVVPGIADLDLDPDVQTARVGLTYKLNFDGSVPKAAAMK